MKAVSLLPPESDAHVEMALPWYVNGTLPEAEHAEVEAHLSACARCRASHHLEVLLQQQFHTSDDTHDQAAESDWEALSSRLEASGAASNRVGIAVSASRRQHDSLRRRARRPLVAFLLLAQAGAIAALAVALVYVLGERSTASYKTLTDSSSLVAPGIPVLRVVFTDETTSATIRALLSQIGGTITSGPGANNVYTIRLVGVEGAPTYRSDEAAKWLRSQNGVLFAEPIGFSKPYR